MKKEDIEEFILNEEFTINNINNLLYNLNTSESELIIYLCNLLNNTNNLYKNKQFTLNIIKLINFISINYIFNNENIKTFRKMLNKLKRKLIYEIQDKNSKILKSCYDELNEICFIKNEKLKDLYLIIKELIDKKENITIIENIIQLDKSCIEDKNNELFDYTFNILISNIDKDNYLNNYYIRLLRIFYSSNIDISKYIIELNKHEDNLYKKELFKILINPCDYLKTKEILEKYSKNISTTSSYYIMNTFDNKIKQNAKIITIDNNNTEYKDDAISITKDSNKYIVQIYIADIPSSIQYKSYIDMVALMLFKNSYFDNENTIRIYNKEILYNLSLNKNKIRKAITLNLIYDNTLILQDYYFTNDIIKVNENYSYQEAEKLIETDNNLLILKLISDELKKQNIKKYKYWNSKNLSKSKEQKELYNYKSHDIISEFSILYNSLIANDPNTHCIFRGQDNSYIPELFNKYNIHIDKYIAKVLDNTYLFPYYSKQATHHNGLNMEKYTQATNPLRKYPDSYNQRLMHKYYFKDIDFDDSDIDKIISYFNIRQEDTQLFEKEIIKKLK